MLLTRQDNTDRLSGSAYEERAIANALIAHVRYQFVTHLNGVNAVANDPPIKSQAWKFSTWFRITFLLVGGVEMFFGVLTLIQGPKKVMSQFGIPEVVVNSPHYIDAMTWVVLHMTFLGSTIVVLGLSAKELKLQKRLTLLFLLFHSVYAFLDIRASDNPLGTALYQGNASLLPAVVSSLACLSFAHLAIRGRVLNDLWSGD